MILYLL
ncbi:uncharacterized protein FTOL_13985 [Fusarium torulosum]|nr:uncharacterized protein FTOL_13985 [Fusarium torulosum]